MLWRRRSTWSLLLLLGACGSSNDPVDLQVAVSLPPIAWLVEQVAGDTVTLLVVLEPGESPATFQPSDSQVSSLMRSAIYFYSGVPFERGRWFDAVRDAPHLETVDLRTGVEMLSAEGVSDPHTWLSSERLAIQAATIAETLARLDTSRSEIYRQNLAILQNRLEKLDEDLTSRLRPYADRAFMVFHPSWGYFAADYGLRQIAVETEGKSPSDIELTDLQRRATQENLDVVFVQPQISGRRAVAVAGSVGGHVESLDPLAGDVIANLVKVADHLVAAFQGAGGE